METHLKILPLFIVFSGMLMKSEVFVGTVGEKVEIRCPYPDKLKYTPKYFCSHPCTSSAHVLIKSKGTEEIINVGRYSLVDSGNGKFFTVIIRNLRLKDSGDYHCGCDQWFSDTINKVHLSVRPAAAVDRPSHTPESTIISTTTSTWTTTLTSAVVPSNNSTSFDQFSPTVQSNGSKKGDFLFTLTVCAGVLVLLFVALVFLYRKRSDSKSSCLNHPVPENSVQVSPDLNRTADVVFHIYDEMMSEYSQVGPATDGSSSVIYSTVERHDPAPQDDVNDFYSLVTHH